MKLFESFHIANMEVANRVGVPPMCTYSVEKNDGVANDFHLAHYLTLAMGLPGFIIQEATAIRPEGRISNRDLGIYTKEQQLALKRIVDAMHHFHPSVKFGIQIGHAGRKAYLSDSNAVAPSPLPFEQNDPLPAELATADVEKLVKAFVDAAIAAQNIGYDFVEIHSAHGYLINQFLSPAINKRGDIYGKNRFLFLEQIIRDCRKALQIPLFVRVSAEEFFPDGLHIQDHVKIAQQLESLGVDFMDVSTAGVAPVKIPVGPMYQVPYATAIKNAVKIPVACVGLITHYEQISEILSENKADVVLLGRKSLHDPFFLLKIKQKLNLLKEHEIPAYLYRGILTA